MANDTDTAWRIIKDMCRGKEFEKARLEIISMQTHRLVEESTAACLFHYVLIEVLREIRGEMKTKPCGGFWIQFMESVIVSRHVDYVIVDKDGLVVEPDTDGYPSESEIREALKA